MKQVNREQFLQTLQCVSPGLSTRDIIEQSSCFVFTGKEVITFNDEIACRMPCDIFGEVDAAVPSKVVDVVGKIPDEMIGLEMNQGELVVSGKGRRAGIRIENEVLLPVKEIERPSEWKQLPNDFCDAVQTVYLCASRDESVVALTCVNITPEMMQARDDAQACRWKMDTGFKNSCLVRQNSIKHVGALGMTHFSEGATDSWLHFKNGTGLIFSCRQWKEPYPSLKAIFSTKDHNGKPIQFSKGTLPRSLAEACENAETFTADNADKSFNRIQIALKPGRLKLRGEGVLGWYEEKKKVKYDGQPMSFLMNPRLLSTLVKRHTEVDLAADRLRVNGGAYTYVTALSAESKPEETNGEEE